MDELGFVDFASTELDELLRYATALTGDRELARDLVQDVLQKATCGGRWWPPQTVPARTCGR